jgi:hypothetical protein
MKNILFILSCTLFSFGSSAQGQKCGAQMLKESMAVRNPAFLRQLDSIHATHLSQAAALKLARQSGTLQKTTTLGTVPIIFHIVLNAQQLAALGGAAGIQERADSEIAVLNRDYNAANGDAYLIPAAFKPVYGNAGITFGLARRTPSGGCSSGYEIITTSATGFDYNGIAGSGAGFSDAKYDSSGGASIWDSSVYLNVWVINPTSPSGIAGLTVPKSFTTASGGFFTAEEGVVINYGCFGVKSANIQYFLNGVNGGFAGGRTLTHEIGHFLEIWHTWGDDGGLCPADAGGQDDGMADTPPEGNHHSGSYSKPLPIVTDNCSSTGAGVMYMNFMDYPDDPYALLFTQDQVTQMQSNIMPGGESYSLTTHPAVLDGTGCPNLSAANIQINHTLTLYPNPTNGLVNIATDNADRLQNITVTNILGQVMKNIIPAAKGAIYSIDMAGMQKGLYFVQCYFTDGRVSGKIILQ